MPTKSREEVLNVMLALLLTRRGIVAAPEQVLSSEYGRLSTLPLRPFPEVSRDQVRADIDTAIVAALGLPDLTVLRDLLSQEPFVCLNPFPEFAGPTRR